MKHDPFEFDATDMTRGQRLWRIAFLLACIAVLVLDLTYWKP